MKRDLLLSFALCLSLTATAQTTAQRLIAKMGIEPKAKVEAPAFIWHDFCPEGKQALKKMLKKAPVSTTVIKETPQGTYSSNWSYNVNTGYSVSSGKYVISQSKYDQFGEVVFGPDNTFYYKNPFSFFTTDTWLKGDVVKGTGGIDTLVIHTPQAVYESIPAGQTEPRTLYAIALVEKNGGNFYTLPVPDSVTTDFKFLYSPTEGIAQLKEDQIMGLCNLQGQWSGYGDKAIWFEPLTDKQLTPPEGLTKERYIVEHTYGDSACVSFCDVAFDGPNVYVGNMLSDVNGEWIKGIVLGRNISFKSGQYLGGDSKHRSHDYFHGAHPYKATYDDETYQLYSVMSKISGTYDPTLKEFAMDSTMSFDREKASVSSVMRWDTPYFHKYEDPKAAPANPWFKDVHAYADTAGLGYAYFYVYDKTADGKYLDHAKLHYNVYFDGVKHTFKPGEYRFLTSDMTDIPYGYIDDPEYQGDFLTAHNTHQNMLFFYEKNAKTIGIQAVYVSDGVEYKSDLITYDMTATTGINGITANNQSASRTVYYDLAGRKVSDPQHGVYIRTDVYSNGHKAVKKVIIK